MNYAWPEQGKKTAKSGVIPVNFTLLRSALFTPFEMIFNRQLPREWIQHEISFPTVYYMSPFEEIQVGLRIKKKYIFNIFNIFINLYYITTYLQQLNDR